MLFIRPIAINIYCRKKYIIDKNVPQDLDSVAQKWDNFGQSIAQYVHTKTSYFYMTFFLGFLEVSIYSVYSLITTSLSAVITSISTGFVAGLGNIYANNEKDNFKKIFSLYEFVNHFVSYVFFTIAIITMIPFVKVYTANIVDSSQYIIPIFGALLIIGELIYCIRLPYYYTITNAGHFKQIKKSAYVEAGLNIVISLLLIFPLGLTGLAIGTMLAMTYRTVYLMIYCAKNITKISIIASAKKLFVYSSAGAIAVIVCSLVKYTVVNFFQWLVYAALIGGLVFVIFAGVSVALFKDDIKTLLQKLRNVVK